MGNYEQLKAAIAAAIKSNGNQEITGAILQSILLSMVNAVGSGAVFRGVATPSTNPGNRDENCFYLAGTAGTYSNFGGFVLNEGLAVLQNTNGSWSGTKILSIALKADTDNIGGSHHLKYNQAAMINLYNVEPISACTENNKLWFKTDGHLYYRQAGTDYDLGTPAYLLYYNGTKIYKYNGTGFTEMSSGGGESVNLDFKTGESVEDISLFGSRASIDNKTDAQLALMMPTGAVIKALFDAIDSIDTSGGTYDGIDQVVTFSFVASTRVLTLKQSGRTAKTITLPLASTSSPGLMSAQDKTDIANLKSGKANLVGANGNLILSSSEWPRSIIRNVAYEGFDYSSLEVGDIYYDESLTAPYKRLYYKATLESNPIDLGLPQERVLYYCEMTQKFYKFVANSQKTDGSFVEVSQDSAVINAKDNLPVSLWIGTQEEFDALTSYDNTLRYLICASIPSQPEVLANPEPIGVLGVVLDPTHKFNTLIDGGAYSDYPTQSRRAAIMIPISEAFPEMPSDYIWHEDASDGSSASASVEEDFVKNTLLKTYTFISAKDVKAIIYRLVSTNIADTGSSAILDPSIGGTGNWQVSGITFSWTQGIHTHEMRLDDKNGYSTDKAYYLMSNHRKTSNNLNFASDLSYRDDFDVLIIPNTWDVKTIKAAQDYDEYFDVTNQWAGGLALYGDYLIQAFTSGRFVILSKSTMNVVATGAMEGATTSYTLHCNALSISNVLPSGSVIPYLYISEWTTGRCICHVESVVLNNGVATFQRLQQIIYDGSKFNTSLNWDWSVDAKTGYLWCVGYAASATDRYGAKVALKFRLPDPTSGNVTLADRDILDEFNFVVAGLQQDMHIENDMMFYMYLPQDEQSSQGEVLIINLATRETYPDYIIPLASLGRETEGICRDGSLLYISSHQNGYNNYDLALHTISLLQSNFNEA